MLAIAQGVMKSWEWPACWIWQLTVSLCCQFLSSLWGLGWYGNSTAYSTSRLICSTRARLNSLDATLPSSGNCCRYGLGLWTVATELKKNKKKNKHKQLDGSYPVFYNSILADCLGLWFVRNGKIPSLILSVAFLVSVETGTSSPVSLLCNLWNLDNYKQTTSRNRKSNDL